MSYKYVAPVCLLYDVLLLRAHCFPSTDNMLTYSTYSFLTEMMQRPYYMDYGAARLLIHKMVTSKYFDLAISAVIGLNVITMAMEFYMMPMV